VRAAAILSRRIKEHDPHAFLSIATRTRTGYEESKRCMQMADRCFLLPLDFAFLMRRLHARLETDVVIVMESDPWWQLLQQACSRGAKCFLVSARLSPISYLRWKKVRPLAKQLFSLFTKICAQDTSSEERFRALGLTHVVTTGNIKWDANPPSLSPQERDELRQELGIHQEEFLLTIGSTHAGEEEALLQVLAPLIESIPRLKILLVPRHPERFSQVEGVLAKGTVPHVCYSQKQEMTGKERIILGDVMGKLLTFYQMADLAVTAGSFFPHLKGHNILEPIQVGTPVFFGPHMRDQEGFVELCLKHGAGQQVSLKHLLESLKKVLTHREIYLALQEGGKRLLCFTHGIVNKIFSETNYFI
jgi:3-deoxy-D-manno-octulosonic-acid transferase